MKVRLLGTGNPVPSLKRASAGYLVHAGDDVILLDHGPGAHWRMLQAGVRAVDVTHVIFSHLHYDHCVDFVRLFLNRWDQGAGRVAPLKVYGPPGLQHFVDRLFGPDGAFALDLTARTTHPESLEVFRRRGGGDTRAWPDTAVTELRESDRVAGDDWEVRLFNVPHHQPHLVSFGLRLESDDGVVAYSSDISHPMVRGADGALTYKLWDDPGALGHYKPLLALARDADLLIQYLHLPDAGALLGRAARDPARPPGNVADRMHELVATVAREARVRTLVLSHLNPDIDRDGVRERVLAEIGAIFDGVVIWGEDLMEIPVGEP